MGRVDCVAREGWVAGSVVVRVCGFGKQWVSVRYLVEEVRTRYVNG